MAEQIGFRIRQIAHEQIGKSFDELDVIEMSKVLTVVEAELVLRDSYELHLTAKIAYFESEDAA